MSGKPVTLRASQLITAFGPGAMVDLPTRSVVIGGLDLWHMREAGSWRTIHEPRAVTVLETLLRGNGRLAEDGRLTLRTPPVHDEARTTNNGGSRGPSGFNKVCSRGKRAAHVLPHKLSGIDYRIPAAL